MKKGVILSMEKKWAYVFTDGCDLQKVNRQPDMALGQEIHLPQPTAATARSHTGRRITWIAAAALLVLIVLLGTLVGTGTYLSPVYATLSVDINPSIEMDLNRSLAVLQIRAMNPDAAGMLQPADYKGLNWADAVLQWIDTVANHQQEQVRTLLLAAIMPEGAAALQHDLLKIHEQLQQRAQEQIQVRVVYSYDTDVRQTARQNGLSIGRQMLLNQSRVQKQPWDAASIEKAPLGDLIQQLLQGEDHDQTGLTLASNAQTLADRLSQDETTAGTRQETQRETHRETAGNRPSTEVTQPTHQETRRETHRESSESLPATEQGTQVTQPGNQPTQPNGSAQAGPPDQTGIDPESSGPPSNPSP